MKWAELGGLLNWGTRPSSSLSAAGAQEAVALFEAPGALSWERKWGQWGLAESECVAGLTGAGRISDPQTLSLRTQGQQKGREQVRPPNQDLESSRQNGGYHVSVR